MQLGKKMQALCLHGEFDSASEPAGTLSLAAVLSWYPTPSSLRPSRDWCWATLKVISTLCRTSEKSQLCQGSMREDFSSFPLVLK